MVPNEVQLMVKELLEDIELHGAVPNYPKKSHEYYEYYEWLNNKKLQLLTVSKYLSDDTASNLRELEIEYDYPSTISSATAVLRSLVPIVRCEVCTDETVICDSQEGLPNKLYQCHVFISHKAEEKRTATELKHALEDTYGMSCFVAHEDIEPTKTWINEMERGLASYDALVYLSSALSNESAWCQQEIGWAMGRQIPLISISLDGCNPPAFLGQKQAIQANGHSVTELAKKVFESLLKSPVSSPVVNGLVIRLANSSSYSESGEIADLLALVASFNEGQKEGIKTAIKENRQVREAEYGRMPERLRNMLA